MSAESVRTDNGARDEPDETQLRRWEQRTEWPMIALSVLFFAGGYAWIVLQPDMDGDLRSTLDVAMWSVWAAFAADYLIRLSLSRRRGRFVLRNLFDLVVIAVPMLRQLRVLRLIMVLVLINRRIQARVRGQVVAYVSGATVLVGVSAALAALEVERGHPDAMITNFGDALWWTMTTITTVGYGDYSPVTANGKLIATGLMLAGIALLGVVTGSIASWFVEKFGGLEESERETRRADALQTEELRGEVADLKAEITALRQELSGSRTDDSRA
ncbi:voltage-gated potassium channel [Prauserella isguenensis]|uniref:Voltage-gated potassium channel n=1 Tax=Prauserella isguenensis TaxID=1470180 RepID=A0A839RY32_9PSEU|nr:potassium channel family protein [Prauserella isguenensis]MBB3050115.1 voltage-gated potassium channel [Prauserella isguenensis]